MLQSKRRTCRCLIVQSFISHFYDECWIQSWRRTQKVTHHRLMGFLRNRCIVSRVCCLWMAAMTITTCRSKKTKPINITALSSVYSKLFSAFFEGLCLLARAGATMNDHKIYYNLIVVNHRINTLYLALSRNCTMGPRRLLLMWTITSYRWSSRCYASANAVLEINQP